MGEGKKEKVISKAWPNQNLVREFSSGGVVYKKEEGKTLWLITKSAVLPKSSIRESVWRLPKGWLDNSGKIIPGPLASGKKKATEEELRTSALREVREEGGVAANIIKKIGTIKFFFNSVRGRVLKFVTFYLMKWEKDLPEGFDFETSEVVWLPYKEAYKRLSFSGEKGVLRKAYRLLI